MTIKSPNLEPHNLPLLNASGITKKFGDFLANDNVSFSIFKGEIHALLGENGAGKSTFVKMVYGLLQPDKGTFEWKGSRKIINGPQHARDIGIGMVFQHFSLFQALTVAENIQLALPRRENLKELSERIREISLDYGISVDPNARIFNLSVGQQQRVEVLRCLLQNPSLLIMDEPTSVLTPQEAEQMFGVLRRFSKMGGAILFISHKLDEVRALTSRATVLRRGVNIGTVDTPTKSTREFAEMMVGDKIGSISPLKIKKENKVLFEIKNLNRPSETQFATTLKEINLQVKGGEILGIAGIAGNGQDELMEALIGEWRSAKSEVLFLEGKDISNANPSKRRNAGIGFVPEERNGHAAVPSMTLSENNLLTCHSQKGVVRRGVINSSAMEKSAIDISSTFDVRTPNKNPLASSLSGGNLQKFIIGREIIKNPRVFIVAQPTWGLDVGAATFIRSAMINLAKDGTAVIMISQDLDEIFLISQRISVLHNGKLSQPILASDVTAEEVGLLMGGTEKNDGKKI